MASEFCHQWIHGHFSHVGPISTPFPRWARTPLANAVTGNLAHIHRDRLANRGTVAVPPSGSCDSALREGTKVV